MIIDLEHLSAQKQDCLKEYLSLVQIPYDLPEEPWTPEEVIEHNRIINEAVARYEKGEQTTSIDELKTETKSW